MAAAYAVCVAVTFGTVLLEAMPSCVDYPQHLAIAAQARDLMRGIGDGRLVVLTYNGLFELVVGAAGLFMPIEHAGRIVLAMSLAAAQWSVWRLVRFGNRPAAYAFACLPFAYSLCFAWGFVNFTLGASLGTLSLIAWLERRPPAAVVALSLLTSTAHVLGAPIYAGGAVVAVLLRLRRPVALAQLVPGLVCVVVAHLLNDPSPHQAQVSNLVFPPWTARLRLGRSLLGSWHGSADEWLAAAVGVILLATLLASFAPSLAVGRRRREPFVWLTAGALAAYAVGPVALAGCWFFYQRAGYLLTGWLPGVTPVLRSSPLARAQQLGLVALGILSTVNFVVHGLPDQEGTDARAIIDAIPRGAHVAPVLDLEPQANIASMLRAVPGSDAFVWGHFPAYAVALRRAQITWMFAREHGHFPVRQAALDFALPPMEASWARVYQPEAEYARNFNYVLVRTLGGDDADEPKARVFGDAAAAAVLVAHHGRFWLYLFERAGGPILRAEPARDRRR